jgi:hypothetical protein
MLASEVIGKYVEPKESIVYYDRPEGNVLGQLQRGIIYGPVYSYIEKNGQLYWMFDYTLPGKTPGAWYIKHKKDTMLLRADTTGTGTGGDNVIAGELPDIKNSPISELVKNLKRFGWLVALVVIGLFLNKRK